MGIHTIAPNRERYLMANTGYIQVTRRCNQNCRFCSNPERDADISLADGIAMIDEMRDRGYLFVIFTGGEPTLSVYLPAFISHCRDSAFMHKLISNGQNLADMQYLDSLVTAGLHHVCISLHSHIPDIQDFLTSTPGSSAKLRRALDNISAHPTLTLDILCTINRYNSQHLCGIVDYLLENVPKFAHITFNNLDPMMNRATDNPDAIPTLSGMFTQLTLAMRTLSNAGKPFQVERVPLCFMAEFPHLSTETRRIVKAEERLTYFLDDRGCLLWKDWFHDKADCCAVCSLNEICAGLFQMDKHYFSHELRPIFIDAEPVKLKILRS